MKPTVSEEIYQFFVKNCGLIISIIIGTAGSLAVSSAYRKLSRKEIFIKVALSVFAGYVSSKYMKTHGMEKELDWAVPLITLLGQNIVTWLMGNSKKLMNIVVYNYFKKNDNNKPKSFGK